MHTATDSHRKPLMNRSTGGLGLAAALAVLSACAGPPTPDLAADEAAIRAVSIAWKGAFNAGDAAAVSALYAQDAVLSAPGVPLVRGRPAIGLYLVKQAAAFAASGLLVSDAPLGSARASGDLGFQWETYRITDKSGAVVDAGSLLTLFERRGGKWLIIADTWNSQAGSPAQPAAAAAPEVPR
jgi:uncharacterized protein (TIGR02246 family)